MKDKIASRIKELRNAKHLTQEEFGKILGVSKQAIANIENAHNFPSYEFVRQLIENFDINLYWFFLGEGEMFRKPETQQDEQLKKYVAQIVDERMKEKGLL